MKELGVALIGAGGIGALRADAVARTAGMRLVSVADVRSDAASAVAGRYGAEVSPGWEAAAADPRVDLLIVSTPPHLHAAMTLAALSSRKHVLCEKPLASSLADARAMCAAADSAGTLLRTGFNHRYFLSMGFARQLVDSGRIGEVISVRAFAGHPGGEEFGHDWIHEREVTGGGSMVDNGIHILDLTRYFFGEVAFAAGYTANLIWPFEGAEDNGFGLFRDRDKRRIATVHATWTEWRGYRFSVEIVGTRGFVRSSYPPMLAEWGTIAEPGRRARRRFELFPLFQIRERVRSWRETIVMSFIEELSRILSDIERGTTSSATGMDGLRAMEMAHAVYRSSAEGAEIAL